MPWHGGYAPEIAIFGVIVVVVFAACGFGFVSSIGGSNPRICLDAQPQTIWIERGPGRLEPFTRWTCLRWEVRP